MNKKLYYFYASINLVALLVTIFVNGMANFLPLNNLKTVEISDSLPNLFVPAGITFAIWGVIYISLLYFVVYSFFVLSSRMDYYKKFLELIGFWFVASSVLNCLWIFFWHYQLIGLALIVLGGMLFCLSVIYYKLQIGLKQPKTWHELYFVQIPFSIYLAWVIVAFFANTTAWLVFIKWDRWGIPENVLTATIIGAITLFGLAMLVMRKDVAFNLVFIWALVGIIIKRTNPLYVPQGGLVVTAWGGVAVLVTGVAVLSLKNLIVRLKKPQGPA